MHLDEIIRHFDNPKPNGANSYMVRCPCHDDKQQSLSITEKDGKILMNCFAGCNSQDILWAVGLKETDLFNNDQRKSDNRPESAEYNYGPDLKKIRFYTKSADGWRKTFCWKHLDENGEWQKGMGGKTPPLYTQYKLDMVRRRMEKSVGSEGGDLFEDEPWTTVFIVEGEKDADTVNNKLGLDAVCSPHGGSKGDLKSKWKPEYSPLFEGLDVAIIPDNDEVGKRFASMVAKEIFPYAKSVRIVDLTREWPDLKEKGDITDVYESEMPAHGRTIAEQVRDKLEALTLTTKRLPLEGKLSPKVTDEVEALSSDPLNTHNGEGSTSSTASDPPFPCRNGNPFGLRPFPLIGEFPQGEGFISEWSKPIPFDDFDLPAFPVEALPSVVRSFVLALSESTQTPADMCASACLAVLALSMQGKYCVMGKADWFEPLNLYILNIARPSERKSTILSAAIKPVNTYEAEYNERNAQAIQESYNELKILEKKQKSYLDQISEIESGKAKKNSDETSDAIRRKLAETTEQLLDYEVKKSKKLYADDITPEMLTELMDEYDGRMSVLSSECGIFDVLEGAYSKSVNIDVFLKAWSGDCIRVDRIGRAGNSIMNPALTMLLMIQPGRISGIMNNQKFRGRGLLARFLYCMPKSRIGHRQYRSPSMPEQIQAEYTELMYDLIDDEIKDTRNPRIIKLSAEADELLGAFSEKLEPMIPKEVPAVAEWMGKLVGTVLRIAGILCRAEAADKMVHTSYADSLSMDEDPDNLIVDGKTMEGAIAIGEYYLSHAQAAFLLMSADDVTEKAQYVLGKIRERRLTEFNNKKILDTCRSFKKVDDIKPVLKRLTEYGWLKDVTPEYSGKGRKPAEQYLVNPAAFEPDNEQKTDKLKSA